MKNYHLNHYSIGFKLGIYILIATLLVISSMSYFFYKLLSNKTEIEIKYKLHYKVQVINQHLQQAELSMKLLGAGIKTLHHNQFTTKKDYKSLVFNSFKQRDPLVMAIGFGQTEYHVLKDKQWFWPYYYVDQKKPKAIGTLLAPPNQNIRYADLALEDSYYQQNYYTEPMRRKIPYWSETYDWYGIIMTSYLLPITDQDGHIIAIGGTDVNVSALAELLNKSVINEVGEFLLFSETGQTLVNTKMTDYNYIHDLEYLLQHISKKNNEGLLQYNGAFWAYEYVSSNNWLMLYKVPKSVVLNPLLNLIIGNTTGAVFILLLLISGFIFKLNKRLQMLVQQCNSMTENEQKRYNKWSKLIENMPISHFPPVIETKYNDELEVLSGAFSIMENQLNISLQVLENYAYTLEDHVAQRTERLNQVNKTLEEQTESLMEARDQATQANIEKSNFIANMSHELRTPLNVIMGYCELLIEEKEESNDIDVSDLYKIHSAAIHLLGLVNDVLNISKIESGKMEIFLQDVDIKQLLYDIKIQISPLSLAQNNHFSIKHYSKSQYLWLDETKCRQILLNLLSNAVKFTEKGKIQLIIEDVDIDNVAYICFRVSDTGIGISAEQQEKLFKPFVQADSSTVRKYGGTGLGLAISKHFAEMMDGFIELDSNLNKGSCFSVYFPHSIIGN